MNSIINYKRAIAASMALLFLVPTFASAFGTGETNGKKEAEVINIEQLDPFYNSDHMFEEVTFKIYDESDNLIYEKTLKSGDTPDIQLVKLLHQSDFLTDNSGTSYFRHKE